MHHTSSPAAPARRTAAFAIAAVGLLLAGCQDSGPTTLPVAATPPNFAVGPSGGPMAPHDSVGQPVVVVTGTSIQVLGTIAASSPCQDIRAEVTRGGRTVRLVVVARTQPVICVGVLGSFAYRAGLGTLPSGRYTIEVVHAYENSGWPTTTVLQREVQIQ